MQIKVYLRDDPPLVAGDVEVTDIGVVEGHGFFVAVDSDGDKRLMVRLNELVAVEFSHE